MEQFERKYGLVFLASFAYASYYYEKKAILLIDEYDVPLDKAYHAGYYEEMIIFIRGLFSEALKTNNDLEFAVLTGCLHVSKESIFTGLNNFKIDTVSNTKFAHTLALRTRK